MINIFLILPSEYFRAIDTIFFKIDNYIKISVMKIALLRMKADVRNG